MSDKPILHSGEEILKWNAMWVLWAEGEVASPYYELMEYYSEVNNGGHYQYFSNVDNCGDLGAAAEAVMSLLPAPLCDSFKAAFDAYTAQEDDNGLSEQCDSLFYEHEEAINEILQGYANTLTL